MIHNFNYINQFFNGAAYPHYIHANFNFQEFLYKNRLAGMKAGITEHFGKLLVIADTADEIRVPYFAFGKDNLYEDNLSGMYQGSYGRIADSYLPRTRVAELVNGRWVDSHEVVNDQYNALIPVICQDWDDTVDGTFLVSHQYSLSSPVVDETFNLNSLPDHPNMPGAILVKATGNAFERLSVIAIQPPDSFIIYFGVDMQARGVLGNAVSRYFVDANPTYVDDHGWKFGGFYFSVIGKTNFDARVSGFTNTQYNFPVEQGVEEEGANYMANNNIYFYSDNLWRYLPGQLE